MDEKNQIIKQDKEDETIQGKIISKISLLIL